MSHMWIPSVEVESSMGVREVSLETRHLTNRTIFINEEITGDTANRFLSEFLYLSQDSEQPVIIYLNSPGGEVNAGLMIYDLIQGSPMEITMVCTGMCASMAACILAGGQIGRRYILPHSRTMIHEPLIAGGVGGSATSIHNIATSILETRDTINKLLAKHTGKSLEVINEATAYDHFMNAADSVTFGICDAVIDKLPMKSQ